MARRIRTIDDFVLATILLGGIVVGALVIFFMTPSHDNLARQNVEKLAKEGATKRSTEIVRSQQQSAPAPAAPLEPKPQVAATQPSPPPAPPAEPTTPPAAQPQKAGLLEQALKLVDEGKPAEAEALFQQVLQEDPNNQTALSELAMIHLIDKKDPQGAIPYLEQVVRLNPDNQGMVTELVNAAHQTGRIDETIQFLQQLPAADNAVIEAGVGKAYQSIGEASKAIPYYEKALENNPADRQAVLENLGDAYLQTGEFNKALGVFENGIASAKETLEREGPTPAAKEQYNTLRIKAATVALDMGRREDAKRMIERLEKDMPQDEIVIALRRQYEESGRQQPQTR